MNLGSGILGLPKGTETLLRDLVHERTGIFFDDQKVDMLIDKLSPLVVKRGFRSFLDYYYLLKYDEDAAAEWENVINAISVGETFFWREIDQVRALAQTIVPQWLAANPGKTLRIWSAACATGEEPLTIAMALHEAGCLDEGRVEIWASDASSAAIEKAKRGVYRDRSFRALSVERRAMYFSPEGPAWRIRPDIHARVKYSVANLVDRNQISFLAGANVIFCRNVFIYFSDGAIGRVLRTFAEFMPTPAHLFVGSSESLIRLTADFAFDSIDDAFVYIKERNTSRD